MTTTRRSRSPRALLRLWPRVRPYRGGLAIATATLILSSTLALAFPLVVRFMLDAPTSGKLNRIALGLLTLFAVQGVLNYIQTYWLTATGERAVAGIRRELFDKLISMPPGFFAERRTGELTSRLGTDVQLLQGVMSHQIAEFSRQLFSLTGGIILLTWLQPRLMLTALGVVPLVVASGFYFGRRLKRITTDVQDEVAGATGIAEEAFSQIRVVQGFAQEPAESRRYTNQIGAVVTAALQRGRIRGLFFGVITFTVFGGITGVLWQGGRLVLSGQLTVGSMVSFLLYTITIAAAIAAITTFFSGFQEAIGAAERVFEFLEMTPAIADPPHPTPLPRPLRGEVEMRHVRFGYLKGDGDAPTLDDISLHLRPGEIVALVGPSGSGKTTIASLLPRFWDVDTGEILLDGIDIRQLSLHELRSAIGTVPQEPALFSGTVRANIAYARPEATPEEVEAAARVANAHDFISELPQGYESRVGERGIKLSGGQRQRIAIARAVLKNPAVLVLDEATSSLDNESERLIEAAFERLLVGRTTLIIAHRLSTVQRADRLVVLDHGCIVEQGTHAELLRTGGIYSRLFQMQWRNGEDLASLLGDGAREGSNPLA